MDIEKAQNYIRDRVEVLDSGCWFWTKSATTGGYGAACFKGTTYSAHRLSYLAFNGEIPPDLEILHSCNRRRCVNPSHLRTGTHAENMQDIPKAVRSRTKNKYTDGQITTMRDMYLAGYTQLAIAQFFRASQSHVCRILTGKVRL